MKISLPSLVLILLLTIDPLGKITLFIDCLEKTAKPKIIILREMLLALIAMLIFFGLGNHFFTILQLSETTVRLASGMILFLVAIRILFPSEHLEKVKHYENSPFLVPLAIPGVASPALLAAIMLFTHFIDDSLLMLSGILISWFIAAITLFYAHSLKRLVGMNGLMASERLMALILVMLSIQRLLDGIRSFIENYV